MTSVWVVAAIIGYAWNEYVMPKAVRGTKETVDSSPLVLESADVMRVGDLLF